MNASDLELNRQGLVSQAQGELLGATDYATIVLVGNAVPALAAAPLLVLTGIAYLVWPPLGLVAFVVLVGPSIALGIWIFRAFRAAAGRRAANRPLRTADGRVAWNGRMWMASESTAKGDVELGGLTLPPGPYRFYVCDDRIVGAESLAPGQKTTEQNAFSITQLHRRPPWYASLERVWMTAQARVPMAAPNELLRVLEDACGFSDADLEANRRGELSSRQGGGSCERLEGPVQLRGTFSSLRFTTGPGGLPAFATDVSLVVGPIETPSPTTVVPGLGAKLVPVHDALAKVVVPGLHYAIYRSTVDKRVVAIEPLPDAG